MASTSASMSLDSSGEEEDFGHLSLSALGQYSHLSAGPSNASTPGIDSYETGYGDEDENSGDEEEEGAWDEVDVEQEGAETLARAQVERAQREAKAREINIVLGRVKDPKGKKKEKSAVSTAQERMIRQERHKVHLICHLTLGLIRNRWISDKEVQARILSIVPAGIVNAFHTFNRHTHPNERDRSRLWEQAVKDVLSWWHNSFRVLRRGHIERQIPSIVEEKLAKHPVDLEGEFGPGAQDKGKGKGKKGWKDGGEVVRSTKSLSKHVRSMEGSRDMTAQLFTALCRALGLGARLVFSLQPMDWRAASAAGGNKAKKAAPAKDSPARSDKMAGVKSQYEWKDGRGELSYKPPPIKLRGARPAVSAAKRAQAEEDVTETAPVMWTELYSPYLRQWITLDPLRKRMRCKDIMEPARSSMSNQLLYVVAFEEDGSARDVTLRYTRSFNNYTAKMRVPNRKGCDWYAELLEPFQRRFSLNRDREEAQELEGRKANEPLPTSLGAFKGHPNYALELQLHKDEVIRPGTKQIGLFSGTHPVYPRTSVVQVKSAENYYRVGRKVKEGEIPLKWIRQQVSTINRKRAEEFILEGGGEVEKQALYEFSQTELYVPPPVRNGIIPRNEFGNIDLFVPSMLPRGAVHLPSKLAAKCAKLLGIAFAEAITGFEFRHRRATPTISGVVVAEENADALIQSIFTMEEANDAKEFRKRQERSLKRWKKLVQGLRIRQRLRAQYANGTQGTITERAPAEEGVSQFLARSAEKRKLDTAPTPVITLDDSPEPEPQPQRPVKRARGADNPAANVSLPIAASPLPPPSKVESSPEQAPAPPAVDASSGRRSLRARPSRASASASSAAPAATTRSTRSRAAVASAPAPVEAGADDDVVVEETKPRSLKLTLNPASNPGSPRPHSPAPGTAPASDGTPRSLRFTINGAPPPAAAPERASANGARRTTRAAAVSAHKDNSSQLQQQAKAAGKGKKREVHTSATPEREDDEMLSVDEESGSSSASTSDFELESDF